jgi:hypothetical protein
VQELFDVFCFTLCWQALRDTMVSSSSKKLPNSGEDDDDAENADDAVPSFSWEHMRSAVAAARHSCQRELLEGRTEALESAFEHCAAIMRLALGHKDSKTAAARGARHHR